MPELAEVEFFRRQWEPAHGACVERVHVHPRARIFREVNASELAGELAGQRLLGSEAQAKQMLFRFEKGCLGIHLGMAGRLARAVPEMVPAPHDHLILYTARAALVFNDCRMFGKVLWARGSDSPGWWTDLPPPVLSEGFTREAVAGGAEVVVWPDVERGV